MADTMTLDQIQQMIDEGRGGSLTLDDVNRMVKLRGMVSGPAQPAKSAWDSASDWMNRKVASVERGLAPYAAGAAIGAAAGAPLAGVGAIPGAAAGAGAVALTDLASLASRGAHAVLGTPVLPSASEVVGKGLDALGVPRPQSTTDRILEATAAGVGGGAAMANGAGVLANSLANPALREAAAQMAAKPGTAMAAGAGSGFGQQSAAEAGAPPWAQFAASIIGGAVGGGIAEGANALSYARSPAGLRDKAIEIVHRRMVQDAKAGGPTAQDILDLQALTPDKPLTLADLGGENTLALAGKMARSPGEGRQAMTNFLNTRDQGAGTRLAGDVDKALGSGSAYDATRALQQARATAAAPKYEEAFKQPVTTADVRPFQRFVTDPIGQDALQKGMRVVELEHLAEGRTFDPEKYGVTRSEQTGKWIIDPDIVSGKKAPSMRMLDAVKRGYDDIVEGFRDPTTGRLSLDQYGRAVNDVRAKYTGALRDKFPKYADALNAWSGPSRSLDALRMGQAFSRARPEEIARQFVDLSPGDREFFKLGVADKLRTDLAKKGAESDEAKAIIGSDWKRSQLRPLFTNQADYDKFINSVQAEARMFGTRYQVLRGSQTAARVAEDQSPDLDAYAKMARGAGQVAGGNHLHGVLNVMNGIKNLLSRPDPALHASVSRLLMDALNAPDSTTLRLIQGGMQIGGGRPPVGAQVAVPTLTRALSPPVPAISGVQQQQQ